MNFINNLISDSHKNYRGFALNFFLISLTTTYEERCITFQVF